MILIKAIPFIDRLTALSVVLSWISIKLLLFNCLIMQYNQILSLKFYSNTYKIY